MPRCTIFQQFAFKDQVIITGREAVLLTFGDRFTVIDPSDNNALIEGMTKQFKTLLEEKGWLRVHPAL